VHVLKRQNAAQQRYLQAIRALATVRKLLRPAVSPVEIALKQVPETTARGRRSNPALSRACREPVLN
jgi:hypothetical protein